MKGNCNVHHVYGMSFSYEICMQWNLKIHFSFSLSHVMQRIESSLLVSSSSKVNPSFYDATCSRT